MATKPKIACSYPRCPNYVEPGHGGLCPKHQRERHKRYEQSRNDRNVTAIYNTKAWKLARRAALERDDGWCVMCKERPADLVDHIVELKDGGCAFCIDNLQSLCTSCHAKKTRESAKER